MILADRGVKLNPSHAYGTATCLWLTRVVVLGLFARSAAKQLGESARQEFKQAIANR